MHPKPITQAPSDLPSLVKWFEGDPTKSQMIPWVPENRVG